MLFNGGSGPDPYKIVMTENGAVRGRLDVTYLHQKPYYAFRGVPYAKPPVGDLRFKVSSILSFRKCMKHVCNFDGLLDDFKAPEPVENWSPQMIDATQFGAACMMPSGVFYKQIERMDENCLNMNIYVPGKGSNEQFFSLYITNSAQIRCESVNAKNSFKRIFRHQISVVNTTSKIPVMVHINGGVFLGNSANDMVSGPDFLVEHGIIIVTFNYRLGIFGFMSLDTPEYSGNMALKDQQMAIQWVYKNIEHFGGDNQKITLSGHSSGWIQILASQTQQIELICYFCFQ